MERRIPRIFQSPYSLENHVSISKHAFWWLNIWILNLTLWTFWLVENQLLNLSEFHTCSFHSTGMQFSCACSSSLSQKLCCHFFMMVATIDMELILLLRLQFFQALGELFMGRLAETREWRIGVQIEEYSIIFYLCICLWGIYCRKEKFGSVFTSWSKHLHTGSSSIRHECGDGHQKSNLQIHLQKTENTSWIFCWKDYLCSLWKNNWRRFHLNFACLDFEAEASSDVCFVVECLQPRLSNSCITPLFISCGTYRDQRSFCIFLPNLVEEKQQRRRKQSVTDMGTTYIKLSLSLSPQSQH